MRFVRSACIVGKKEFGDALRNFWLIIGPIIFALLSVAVIFGTAAIGGTFSFRPLDAVMNSTVTLGVFFIPLIAILISYDSFVGEKEGNTLILLLTYPISRISLLVGKLIGSGTALLLCLILGFSLLPLLTLLRLLPYDLYEVSKDTFFLICSGWLLGFVFILISFSVSLVADRKAKALAILLAIWLVSVFLYDLGLLVATIAFQASFSNELLTIFMELNPASAFRLFNTEISGGSALKLNNFSAMVYLFFWAVILFTLNCQIFRKRTI